MSDIVIVSLIIAFSMMALKNLITIVALALTFNVAQAEMVVLKPDEQDNYTGIRILDNSNNVMTQIIAHQLSNVKPDGTRHEHNHFTIYTSKSNGVDREGRFYIDSHRDTAGIYIKDSVLVIGAGGNSRLAIRDDGGTYREIRVDAGGNLYTQPIVRFYE